MSRPTGLKYILKKENPTSFKKGKKVSGNPFPKGHSPWNKGKKTNLHPPNTFKRGQYAKEKNVNWKGGITALVKQIRQSFKSRQWKSDIFQRDDYTCQECGSKGVEIQAHHIKRFSLIISENHISTLEQALDCEELWNINNGLTLCKDCHIKTENYGNYKK